jgi:hypothetical protein
MPTAMDEIIRRTNIDEAKSAFDIGPNGMGLDLLRAVYRNPSVDLSIRLRCCRGLFAVRKSTVSCRGTGDREQSGHFA